jgi:DNA-binding LacI/PurR family transcriptional regulator
MKTLAESLDVSVATVSNAFSRPDQLSAELRERILAKADELGYTGPLAAGRALRSGRNDVCGFVFGGELSQAFADPYSVILLSGLTETVEEFGASVLLLRASAVDRENPLLQRAPIDALVALSGAVDLVDFEFLRRRGTPVVTTRRLPDRDWVSIDDDEAGRLIGRHLARLGHRDVVVLSLGAPRGTIDDFDYTPDRPCPYLPDGSYEGQRVRGLWETLPKGSVHVVRADANTREAGRRAAAHILDIQDRPTAVVAVSDVLAYGVLDAVHERGLVPGRDISVSGFDDLPDAAFLGITTVRQPIAEKGRLAGRLAMDPDYPTRQITLPIELIVRSSTGPAPR